MSENLIGVDIGGTKCAVIFGSKEGHEINLVDEYRFPTGDVGGTIKRIIDSIEQIIAKHSMVREDIGAIGISCGGPLDSKRGVIMSPPNLPGWDKVPIVEKLYGHFGIQTGIQNDANACALAEWKFGAGKGVNNMVFMTFGTGLGAGLILGGKLYSGTNDNAGELGHFRLSEYGPVGYGKAGSFEGFCSGAGIAQIAKMVISEKLQSGISVNWCAPGELEGLSTKKVAGEAFKGDELALRIFDISASKLGEGLSLIIDLLNPELIVIGGVYTRCTSLFESKLQSILLKEALPNARKACRILPSELTEDIGSYSALSVAADLLNKNV